MATIPCPDCKKKVSENAESCPKCGAPITPEYAEEAKEKDKKRNVGCALIIFALFAIGFVMDKCSPDENVTTASVQTAPVSTAQSSQPILGISVQTFADDFDANAAELNISVTDTKVDGNVVTAMVGCCAALGMTMTDGPEKFVKEAYLIMSPDGTSKAGYEMAVAMGCLLMTTDPAEPKEFRGKIIKDLGLSGTNIPERTSVIRGNHKYWFQKLEGIGLQFGVSAVN